MIKVSRETALSMVASLDHLGEDNWKGYMLQFWEDTFKENESLVSLIFANMKKSEKEQNAMLYGAFLVYMGIKRQLEGEELEEMMG